jgi:O-antigen/teichoic acid export membrane protein
MSLKTQALKNVGSSWFGLAVNMLVGFFVSPFILHRLGDEAFGLWVLTFSVTGYYGLFDLGIRSSIIKHVAHYTATKDDDGLARTINTSLFTYSCVALVLLLATFAGSAYVDRLFHVSPDFLRTARLLFLMVGSAIALGFPLGVFGGVLEGLQKFYWLNLTQAASTLLRALLIVIALNHGQGLVTVALITVALPLIAACLYILAVRRFIAVHLRRKFVDLSCFRQLMGYGSITFIIIVAEQLRFQTDAVIIGVFLSASAITAFSIGSKLADYAVGPVHNMADIFLPMASHFEATQNTSQLRRIFLEGNRVCGFIMFPICVTLLILGKSLIGVWVGSKYVPSYVILVLLLVPKSLYRAQAASNRVLFGMARHRPLAVVAVAEGVTNLILSIALIRPLGIVGDAVGTAVPLLVTSLLFLPLYACRVVQVPMRTFLRQAYLLPLGLCAPLVGTLLSLQHLFRARTYPQLLIQVLAGGLVYGAGLAWFFLAKEPMGVKLREKFTRRLSQAF